MIRGVSGKRGTLPSRVGVRANAVNEVTRVSFPRSIRRDFWHVSGTIRGFGAFVLVKGVGDTGIEPVTSSV